jgi:hypothetical protein
VDVEDVLAVLDHDLLSVHPGSLDVSERLAGFIQALPARVLEALGRRCGQLDDLGNRYSDSFRFAWKLGWAENTTARASRALIFLSSLL